VSVVASSRWSTRRVSRKRRGGSRTTRKPCRLYRRECHTVRYPGRRGASSRATQPAGAANPDRGCRVQRVAFCCPGKLTMARGVARGLVRRRRSRLRLDNGRRALGSSHRSRRRFRAGVSGNGQGWKTELLGVRSENHRARQQAGLDWAEQSQHCYRALCMN